MKYNYTSTGNNPDQKKKKKNNPVFLFFFLTILIFLYFYFINSQERQLILNQRASMEISKSQKELDNIMATMDSLGTIYTTKGKIYLEKEEYLKKLIFERKQQIKKLKVQLSEQKVLKKDYNILIKYNNEINIELVNIVNKNDSSRLDVIALDTAIAVLKDSIRILSHVVNEPKKRSNDAAYCSPRVVLTVEPLSDCDKDSISYKPSKNLKCFKLVINANELFKGYNDFNITVQNHKGVLCLFKLKDVNNKALALDKAIATIKIKSEGTFDYKIELTEKIKAFPIKFIISQATNCKEPFSYPVLYPTQ